MCVCVCVCCVCVCVCVLTRPQTWYTPPFLSFGGYVTCLPDECKNGIKQNRRRQHTHTHAHVYVCVSCLKMRRLEKQRKINSSKRPFPRRPCHPHTLIMSSNCGAIIGGKKMLLSQAQLSIILERRERERENIILLLLL